MSTVSPSYLVPTVYVKIRLIHVGIMQIIFSLSLIAVSVYNVSIPPNIHEVNFDNKTRYAIVNYQVHENGTKYIIYPADEFDDYDGGEIKNIGKWFDHILLGKYVYMFGASFENFCWPRDVPDNEWFPSLFKASQLKPLVQVPVRAVILLGMSLHMLRCLSMAFLRLQKSPTSAHSAVFAIFMMNEILLNVSLFGLTNYLFTPDEKFFYLMLPVATVAHLTFGLKMMLAPWLTGLRWTTFVRIALAMVAAYICKPAITNIMGYLEHPVCDAMTDPWAAVSEYAGVAIVCIAGILDVVDSRGLEVLVYANLDEYSSYYEEIYSDNKTL